MRRHLAIVPANEKSLHLSWFRHKKRTFDIFTVDYSKEALLKPCPNDYYLNKQGSKWVLIAEALSTLTEEQKAHYHYVWFPDDDIYMRPDLVDRLFNLAEKMDIQLGQPSLSRNSYAGQSITYSVPFLKYRLTNYTEVMAPFMKMERAIRYLPYFKEADPGGWWLEAVWQMDQKKEGFKIMICDRYPMTHTRPLNARKKSELYKDKNPWNEEDLAYQKYGLSRESQKTLKARGAGGLPIFPFLIKYINKMPKKAPKRLKAWNCYKGGAGGGIAEISNYYEKNLIDYGVDVTPVRIAKKKLKELTIISSGHYNPLGIIQALIRLAINSPNIVICHCSRSASIIGVAAKILHIPIVSVTHSGNVKNYRFSSHIIALTDTLADVVTQSGIPLKKVSIIPNPIPVLPSPNENKACLQAHSPDLRIGFIGRLHKWKGAHILMQACNILKGKGVSFSLSIAGNGDELDNLKQMVSDYNLNDNVQFLGWISDKASFFSEVDCVVFPTVVEVLPTVVLEAFQTNTPVIISKFINFSASTFKHNENCLVVDGLQPEDYAEAIELLLNNSSLTSKLTKQAEIDFYSHFSAEKVFPKISSLLHSLGRQT